MDLWAVGMPAVGLHARVCEILLRWKGSLLLPLMEGLGKVGEGRDALPNASKNECP